MEILLWLVALNPLVLLALFLVAAVVAVALFALESPVAVPVGGVALVLLAALVVRQALRRSLDRLTEAGLLEVGVLGLGLVVTLAGAVMGALSVQGALAVGSVGVTLAVLGLVLVSLHH